MRKLSSIFISILGLIVLPQHSAFSQEFAFGPRARTEGEAMGLLISILQRSGTSPIQLSLGGPFEFTRWDNAGNTIQFMKSNNIQVGFQPSGILSRIDVIQPIVQPQAVWISRSESLRRARLIGEILVPEGYALGPIIEYDNPDERIARFGYEYVVGSGSGISAGGWKQSIEIDRSASILHSLRHMSLDGWPRVVQANTVPAVSMQLARARALQLYQSTEPLPNVHFSEGRWEYLRPFKWGGQPLPEHLRLSAMRKEGSVIYHMTAHANFLGNMWYRDIYVCGKTGIALGFTESNIPLIGVSTQGPAFDSKQSIRVPLSQQPSRGARFLPKRTHEAEKNAQPAWKIVFLQLQDGSTREAWFDPKALRVWIKDGAQFRSYSPDAELLKRIRESIGTRTEQR